MRVRRQAPPRLATAAGLAVTWLAPALARAHERWVNHAAQPFNRDYFHSMSGEVLQLSLLAAAAVTVVIGLWYVAAVVLVERLTPTSVEQDQKRNRRAPVRRFLNALAQFFLDGYVRSRWLVHAEKVAVLVFARLPGLVMLLGAAEGWLLMPSFPVPVAWGVELRAIEVIVALWILSGRFQVGLGGALLVAYAYLCLAYRLAAVDATPLLASAFFYLYARKGTPLNGAQMAGIRFGLGIGFVLLGLVNKIYDAELFIGVGDNYPALVAGPQRLFPWLTRESWSFTTALGEMIFGLLLFLGIFNRLTSLVLALVFANFILVFGWAEIVHLYPISGFAVLFFRAAPAGTALDGILFRTHVRAWRALGFRTSFLVYRTCVYGVAVAVGALLIFAPLYLTIELAPRFLR